MKDTSALRQKLLVLWARMEDGKISPQEARTHIGFARATLDTLKVEIAAAHLNLPEIPAVPLLSERPVRVASVKIVPSKKAA